MAEVMDELLKILSTEDFGVNAENVDPTETLDEIGVDSIAVVELIDIVESVYKIKIEDDEFKVKSTTLAQVVATINERVQAA